MPPALLLFADDVSDMDTELETEPRRDIELLLALWLCRLAIDTVSHSTAAGNNGGDGCCAPCAMLKVAVAERAAKTAPQGLW